MLKVHSSVSKPRIEAWKKFIWDTTAAKIVYARQSHKLFYEIDFCGLHEETQKRKLTVEQAFMCRFRSYKQLCWLKLCYEPLVGTDGMQEGAENNSAKICFLDHQLT